MLARAEKLITQKNNYFLAVTQLVMGPKSEPIRHVRVGNNEVRK